MCSALQRPENSGGATRFRGVSTHNKRRAHTSGYSTPSIDTLHLARHPHKKKLNRSQPEFLCARRPKSLRSQKLFSSGGKYVWESCVSHQPVVEFLGIRHVVRVWRDAVAQPFNSLNAFAAFMGQESSLSWTVDASLRVLPESPQ